jgi:nickel-dependent lactate racemase
MPKLRPFDGFTDWQQANGEHVTTTVDGEEVVDLDTVGAEIAREVVVHYTAQAVLAAAIDFVNAFEAGAPCDVTLLVERVESYREATDLR